MKREYRNSTHHRIYILSASCREQFDVGDSIAEIGVQMNIEVRRHHKQGSTLCRHHNLIIAFVTLASLHRGCVGLVQGICSTAFADEVAWWCRIESKSYH